MEFISHRINYLIIYRINTCILSLSFHLFLAKENYKYVVN